MAGKGLATEGAPGYRGLLSTAGSPSANSKNSELGALYSQVPRGKLWVCFKPRRSRTSVYIFAYLYRRSGGFMCIFLLYKGCATTVI